jgi:hypothetical protein
VQLARALAPERAIWLAHQPKTDSIVRAQAYQTAVADAQAYGARWVVSLDDKLATALATRASEALETWKAIATALAFFETRKEWGSFQTKASLAVISSYSGEDEFLAAEILNLLTRRGVPQQIVLKSKAAQTKFEGLKGIVYADSGPPDPALAKRLAAFVTAGGFLLAGPKYPAPQGEPSGTDVHHRYDLRRVGKGRIALAKEDLADPYLVAADAQLILSHRYDPVRFFNSSTLIPCYTASGDGRRALLQMINYAMRPGTGPVSAAFTERYRTARFWQLGASAPAKLDLTPVETGVEAYLPPFGVYAAIELE